MSIIIIDGIKVKVEPPDLDGDGKIGGVEVLSSDRGVTNITQPTELGETLKELNKDEIEVNTRMSGIDLRSRLHYIEISSILALDALVSLKIMPVDCLAFSRQKKRLAVSLDGKGRDDIVNIVSGKRELDAKTGMSGFKERLGNFFGGNAGNQVDKQ